MIFDEWPIWPRSYFHAEQWLRRSFDAATTPKNQTVKPRRALLDRIRSVSINLERVDFDHPHAQPALWFGGIVLPLLVLVIAFS